MTKRKQLFRFARAALCIMAFVGSAATLKAALPVEDPATAAEWADIREVALDTRERLVVTEPEEVLPIAYSTNFWGAAKGEAVKVTVSGASIPHEDVIVPLTNANGYAQWRPRAGEYGIYTLTHNTSGEIPRATAREIVYSAPFPLTLAAAEAGGVFVAITNGFEESGSISVLGFEKVTIVAKPVDARWEVQEMYVLTNGFKVTLAAPMTSLTNHFAMPFCDTVVTGVFRVAESYTAAATNQLTASYLDDIAYLESILTGSAWAAAKADVAQAYDDGVIAIRAAPTPTGVDAAKASALETLAETTRRHCKFPITYYATGGGCAGGVETNVVDAYLDRGYEFPPKDPTRDNFIFDGWFRSWSNRNEQVSARDTAASPVQPLAAHGLYAQWTPVSTDMTEKDVAIPDMTNGVPVTTIESFAYAQASHPLQAFETLVTPLYLQSIGRGAFQGVTTLKTLIITPSRSFDDPCVPVALVIDAQAFASCTALEEVRIPGEVAFIGDSAFQNCAKLKRVLFTGTETIAYGSKAFYRCGYNNGAGELKVYMTKEFSSRNEALVRAFASWNTTLKVVPLVDVSPASGAAPTIAQADFGTLGEDRKVALLVKVPTLIPGMKPDVSSVVVKHSTDLTTWNALSTEATTAAEDGTVLIEFALPTGSAGFMKVEIR